MGRDIKFRAWNENYKQMKKLSGIDMEIKRVFLDDNLMSWWMLDHCEVMQYTGLNDKNGKEIYEGDLVKNKSGVIRKTIFYKHGFCLEDKFLKLPLFKFNSYDELEIIGNIYEAPHLL